MSSALYLCCCLLLAFLSPALSQTPTLGLADGFITLDSPSFAIQLVKDSQTLASLKPKPAFSNNPIFDFVPFDQLSLRQFNGNYYPCLLALGADDRITNQAITTLAVS